MARLGSRHTANPCSRAQRSHTYPDQLLVLSANVRGFRTNVGELTHSCILKHDIDIVITVETFLDETVEATMGKIPGYSHWQRRDRVGMQFGGIAVCYKDWLHIQRLEVQLPDWMEAMFFRVILSDKSAVLLCAMYRPQWQGSDPLTFLSQHLDQLLTRHSCQNIMIIGDLNQHLVQPAFDELLMVQGLQNHVTFPTHILGGSLDPVLTDLADGMVHCSSLGQIGSSDHMAILSRLNLRLARDESFQREIWLWPHADWSSIRLALQRTNWEECLAGTVDDKVEWLTGYIISLQHKYVPHRSYSAKPSDQPWFGFRCKQASQAKYKAWRRYKQHPTNYNKSLHHRACITMEETAKWAIKRWEDDTKTKLRGNQIGTKQWWSLIKEKQGLMRDDTIPPLTKDDGSSATSALEKAELLADMFSRKMKVEEPDRMPPHLPQLTNDSLSNIIVRENQVRTILRGLNVKKALGPDKVSPHFLKHCADELAPPLTAVFNSCFQDRKWPKLWKHAQVTPVHKKNSRSLPKNYRPISLLAILSKVMERIIADSIVPFFDQHSLITNRQYGFRKGRSAADILLLMSKSWNDALDSGKDTLVIALDIAGAFDRVWHAGLLAKLQSMGIQGGLLELLRDYLQHRTLSVAINGHLSGKYPIDASVPQGSVLGPILWNVYINDLLQQLPTASAYADDCTLSCSYKRQDSAVVGLEINQLLKLVASWGSRWQSTFAPEKTQAMVISRSPEAARVMEGKIKFNENILPISDCISILGVDFDKRLNFGQHLNEITRKASLRVSTLRRMKHLLDARGLQTLYRAQVRPFLEYAPLAWMSTPKSYLTRLDKVQLRAQQLIAETPSDENYIAVPDVPLEHRRDVAILTVMHKAQIQRVTHLQDLQLPTRRPQRTTRSVLSSECQVDIPGSSSSIHQRTYICRAARLWNAFTASVDVAPLNTNQVKSAAHRWRLQQLTPLTFTII